MRFAAGPTRPAGQSTACSRVPTPTSRGACAEIVPVALDEPMLAPLFARATGLGALESPPAPRKGCEDCAKLDAVHGLLG